MFRQKIGEEYLVLQGGTSEGTQVKYKKDGYWYKKDSNGSEGLVEYLVSRLLQFSDLDASEYICYEQGTINGRLGCRSRSFLAPGDEFVTFYRLYYNEYGKNLASVIGELDTLEKRISYVIEYIRESCGLDVTDYLRKVLTLDMLVLNEDRHFNNLGVIFRDEQFVPAPIFDNGVSLLTANISVNWNFPMEENVRRVNAKPFYASFESMVDCLGVGLHLDVAAALEWLEGEPQGREVEVLEYQLRRYALKIGASK